MLGAGDMEQAVDGGHRIELAGRERDLAHVRLDRLHDRYLACRQREHRGAEVDAGHRPTALDEGLGYRLSSPAAEIEQNTAGHNGGGSMPQDPTHRVSPEASGTVRYVFGRSVPTTSIRLLSKKLPIIAV